MAITSVTVRRRVDDLDAHVPFYEQLTGQPARRFAFDGTELAAVGCFLLFCATDTAAARLERVAATLAVDDLDGLQDAITGLGAEVLAPAAPTPNGRRLVARHPDGLVVEYVGR